jgi:hypothetical protein
LQPQIFKKKILLQIPFLKERIHAFSPLFFSRKQCHMVSHFEQNFFNIKQDKKIEEDVCVAISLASSDHCLQVALH